MILDYVLQTYRPCLGGFVNVIWRTLWSLKDEFDLLLLWLFFPPMENNLNMHYLFTFPTMWHIYNTKQEILSMILGYY